jgi:hypothetical protein
MTNFNSSEPQVPVQPIGKPMSVMVFGVLNIIFGGIGLLWSPVSIFGLVISSGASEEITRGYEMFLLLMNLVGFGFSIWLLTLGIGLLIMKKWARRGSVLYGWLGILLSFTETAVNILARIFSWITVPEGGAAGYIVGNCICLVGGLIYPVLLLIFMQTARVKQAFQIRGQSA